jgi:hypothetical protein
VFVKLANHLYNIGAIKDLNLLSIEEKLLIFLLVFAANNSYHKVAEETQYSTLIVHK